MNRSQVPVPARCTIHFHGNDLEAEAERSLQASIQSVYKGGGRRLKDAKPNSQVSTTRSTLKFNLYKRGYNLREHASSRQFGVMSKKPHTSLASFVDRFLCSQGGDVSRSTPSFSLFFCSFFVRRLLFEDLQ